jgi:hypothetical protein
VRRRRLTGNTSVSPLISAPVSWSASSTTTEKTSEDADPPGIIAHSGYPFTPANGINFNAPHFAHCGDPKVLACPVRAFASVADLNHQFSPLDNLTFRAEYFDDMQGQRTGTQTRHVDFGLCWQHWFSPQIELCPEVAYYRSLDAPAFNADFNANPVIPPSRRDALIAAADLICHF